ncbi:MAG: hypothetical protein ACLFSS_03800 [Candidatus Aenigmatarchaeota archaeon]
MNLFLKDSGQFFSIISVVMVLPLVALSITFGEAMSGYGANIGEHVRLKSGYYYYNSLEEDLGRASEIIGERALISAINHTVETGEGLDSSEEVLRELFVNGTIDGKTATLMNNTGIDGWFGEVEKISRERGYVLELSKEEPDMRMPSPYRVSFNMNYSMDLEDEGGLFSLKKSRYRENLVSVEGLEDPVVTLGTGGKFSLPVESCGFDPSAEKIGEGIGNNSWGYGEAVVLENEGDVEDENDKVLIIEDLEDDSSANDFAGAVVEKDLEDDEVNVPYVTGVDGSGTTNGTRVVVEGDFGEAWNIESLHTAWDESCYFPVEAPDFLQRLENDLEVRSGTGIGVFLKKGEMDKAGLEVEDRSNLAHIYFSEEDTKDCKVKGMPESFKVDEGSAGKFGIDETLRFECG